MITTSQSEEESGHQTVISAKIRIVSKILAVCIRSATLVRSGLVNDLSFTHTGNRMTSLIDANAIGNDAGTKAFTYDANGNMTSDGRKGLEMSWNLLNLADSAACTATFLAIRPNKK